MNILFVTNTRIGDAVLSTGLLSHLISRFPEARITVACGPLPAPLFESAPGVERVIGVAKRPVSWHWVGLWSDVIGTAWDLVIDLRGSGLAWTLRSRERRVLRRADDGFHRVEALGHLFDLSPPPSPNLWSSVEQKEAAYRLLPADVTVLAICPTANWAPKIWPAERFVELCQRLSGSNGILRDAQIAVFGGPGEREIAQPVLEAISTDRRIDLVDRLDLPTVAACLHHCRLCVANDSGLMHIAAAVGTPTLGLFGPSRASHYAPWGPHCAVAQTEIPYAELVGGSGFDFLATAPLMTSLSVDVAEREARALWRRTSDEAA